MYRTVFVLATVLAGCGAPSGGLLRSRSLTPQAEALAGKRAAPALEARYGGLARHTDAVNHLARIGRRLCEGTPSIDVPYQFALLGTDEFNAFSLPGGRVYVTHGLYRRLATDDLLAAAIAHEMAHIATKDHFKPRAATGQKALEREIAADRLAVRYLQAAHFSSTAAVDLIRCVEHAQRPGWADRRIEAIEEMSAPSYGNAQLAGAVTSSP